MNQVPIVFALLICVLLGSCCTLCYAIVFADCGSTLGKFTEVSVSGCHVSDPKCTLVCGANASISINFMPNTNISDVIARVYGRLIDIDVPFPLDNPDVCTDPNSGVHCPLCKDQQYHYTTTMLVQKKFPKVNVGIKWELIDDKQNKIVCVSFPAKLV